MRGGTDNHSYLDESEHENSYKNDLDPPPLQASHPSPPSPCSICGEMLILIHSLPNIIIAKEPITNTLQSSYNEVVQAFNLTYAAVSSMMTTNLPLNFIIPASKKIREFDKVGKIETSIKKDSRNYYGCGLDSISRAIHKPILLVITLLD
jgi:hypothetical protein